MGSIPLVVKSGNVDVKYFRGTLTSICQVQKKRRMKKKNYCLLCKFFRSFVLTTI